MTDKLPEDPRRAHLQWAVEREVLNGMHDHVMRMLPSSMSKRERYRFAEGVEMYVRVCTRRALYEGRPQFPDRPTKPQAAKGLTSEVIEKIKPEIERRIHDGLLEFCSVIAPVLLRSSDIFEAQERLENHA